MSESTDPAERLKYDKRVLDILLKMRKALKDLPRGSSDEAARKVFTPLVEDLLKLSKCPDLIVNYFGTDKFQGGEPGLSDEDKRALIEFLKTF